MKAIYTRQSIDKKDSVSIENQIDFCKKEISEKDNYKIYTDKGFSGSSIKRPAFEEMIQDIEKGVISKVVVYKLDRISRSILDFSNIMEIFNNYDVQFVSVTEKFDTSTPMGRAMLNITAVFAQLERETIQQRIKDAYYTRGKKGMFLGGNLPYGFDKEETIIDNKKSSILIQNKHAETVKEMYRMYSEENMSLRQISTFLNKENIKSHSNKNWDSHKVSRTLKNPVYVKADADIYSFFQSKNCIMVNDIKEFKGEHGLFSFGNIQSQGNKFKDFSGYHIALAPHKGIVDSKTWIVCQYRLSNNKQIKNTGKSKKTWLSGLVKCGYCSYSMGINTAGNISYYRCMGNSLLNICDAKSKRVKDIESSVELGILKKLKELSSEKHETKIQTKTSEANSIKLKLMEIDNKIEKLIDSMLEAEDITMNYINKRMKKLEAEKQKIQKSLSVEMQDRLLDMSQVLNVEKTLEEWDDLSIQEKKDTASKIINKVYVKDDEIRIDWKY